MALQVNRDFMQVVETEYVRFLRHENPRVADKIMSYVIPGLDIVVVAEWLNKDNGDIHEITSYPLSEGPNLSNTNEARFWFSVLRRRWLEKTKEVHREQTYKYKKQWQEATAAAHDRNAKLVQPARGVLADDPMVTALRGGKSRRILVGT